MSWNHRDRLAAAASAFEAASAAFMLFIERLPDELVHEPLPGGWTPAGHAKHVALTNEVFLSVTRHGPACSGPITPFEGHSDYSDATWSMDAPPAASAPPILVPPEGVTRDYGLASVRDTIPSLSDAIRTVTPDLAVQCVRLPWATISVYQMCEWASGHTLRHLQQVNRELQMRAMGAAVRTSASV